MTSLDGKVALARSPGFTDPHADQVFDRSGDLFALGLVQAELRDLDGDGTPEVLCAIHNADDGKGGRLMVFNHRGNPLWQYDTNHDAPPGRGRLKSHDEMTHLYRVLTPQWAEITGILTQDTNRNGKNELLVWCGFGTRTEFVEERIHCAHILDFQGQQLGMQAGDEPTGGSSLVDPGQFETR